MKKTKKKQQKKSSVKLPRNNSRSHLLLHKTLEKKFGKGSLSFANQDAGYIERLPLGIAPIDWLTCGGLPLGKATMFRGPESGTKTTLAILACARYLERFPSRVAIYIDIEEKYPAPLVKRLGINPNSFATATLETSEQTIDFIEDTLRWRDVGIIVIDSLAALVPRIEINASAEDQQQGVAAREINKLLRKMVGALKAARLQRGWSPTVILINQERFKIGIRYGDPTTMPGGEGQKYFVSLSLRLRTLKIKNEDKLPEDAPIVKVSVVVRKHSFGPEGKSAEYFFAMEDFRNLKTGDAMDEDFLWRMAQKLNLIDALGSREELGRRKEFYHQLKKVFLETLERKT